MLGREAASSRGAVCFSSCCCWLCFLTLWDGEADEPPFKAPLCLLGVWSVRARLSLCAPSAGGPLCWDAPHVLEDALLIPWCPPRAVSPASVSPAVVKRVFFFLLCLFYFLGALFAEDVGRSVASCWHRLVLQHCSGGTGIQSPRSGMLQDPCCVPTHGCWGWRGAHSTAAYPSAHRRKCRGLF